MFVCVSRLTLEIPAAGSLKAKRQVLRRITDRVKARFNVSVAEVDDLDVWQRAVVALAVVGNDRRHVNEQMDKIIQFVEDMYVAPLLHREMEIISFGSELFGHGAGALPIERGERSLAEAEGMGDWERRYEDSASDGPAETASSARTKEPREHKKRTKKSLTLDEARAKARSLRNPREWEKE